MKTLNIKTDESIEVNLNGISIITDFADPHIPMWALDDFYVLLNQLRADGCHEIHIEKNDYQYFVHCRKGTGCMVMDMEEPTVFTRLERFMNEYNLNSTNAEAQTTPEEPVVEETTPAS